MSASQILLAARGQDDRWLTESPNRTYFETKNTQTQTKHCETYEIPFEQSAIYYGESAVCTIPPKGELVKRLTLRSTLPELYTPLGPGYVYPLYTDEVNGAVYVPAGTTAIQPGDFIGYFNTQFLGAWATNFVGQTNISVRYDSALVKFVFTSTVYEYIYFQDDMSGVFWGFDPRSFDFVTTGGFNAYRFVNNTITAPLTLFQAGWIRGFTPPPGVGFSYVDSVACRLVKNATLLIGGQTIDQLTSDRLIIEDDLGVAYENQAGLAILEGKGDTSQVYAPREYYTRLTFNMNKLNMKALSHQDVQVNIEYEKFENLPQKLITTKSLTDGGSYVNTNIKTVLGLPDSIEVFHTVFYKKYILYVINDPNVAYHQRYYFYDTTKPQQNPSSWVYWYDPEFHQSAPLRPYFIGGTMYITALGQPYIRSVPVANMLTGIATPTVGASIFPNLYEGRFTIDSMTADARYLYIRVGIQNATFGSNTAYLYDYSPGGIGSINIPARTYVGPTTPLDLVYKVLSISTPQLVESDNVAIVNFVTNNNGIAGPTKVYTITNETKVGSDINVTVRISFSSTTSVNNLPVFYTTTSVPLTGSNVATFISCTPECAFANVVATYKVYNIATSQLTPSDNTAANNWITNASVNFGGITKNVTITSQTKTLSNIFLTANVAYTYTSNGQPAPRVFEYPLSNPYNPIFVRYDTTRPIGLWSSYDFLSYPGTGAPKSWFDITGQRPQNVTAMALAFDGRYIYGDIQSTGYFLKTDTQDFLNLSSYTYVNVNTITPTPILVGAGFLNGIPNATDGRYFYFQTNQFQSGSVYLTRYDSTQSISSPSAFSSIQFTSNKFPSGVFYTLYPGGFDGKSIYYVGGSYIAGAYKVFSSIVRYDTTTNSVSDWIIFDGTGQAQTSSGTTVSTISWAGDGYLSCLVSARYVYITETWGGGSGTFKDLVQFDPLVMNPTLTSSMLVKYETYDVPKPLRSQNLYGQTVTNKFTILQGQSSGSFKLDVQGPVREFWVTVDVPGVINHVVFRLNNEVLVDDDQVMTRYIRAFEAHTSMPSSSNVCVYSVAWNPEDLVPSGTINMSRIAEQFVDVTLVAQAPSNLTVQVYSKTFNILATQGGLGGLLFNFSL